MNSHEPFVVTMVNPKRRLYIRLAYFFTAILLFAFILFLCMPGVVRTGIAGIAAITVYFLIKRWELSRNKSADSIDENIFFLIAVIWLSKNVLIAFLLFVTGILLRISLQKFRYVFSSIGVTKSFFPKKTYSWSQIDSVILKAGLLTINFKNNHLIQGITDGEHSFSEEAFNEFVGECLVWKNG